MLGAAYPGILRAENAAGMVLVNDTWTYTTSGGAARQGLAEVDGTSSLLRGVTGDPVRCRRRRYGLSDPQVQADLRVRGLAEARRTSTRRLPRPGAGVTTRRVLAALHPGAIAISHDRGGTARHRRRPARHHRRHPRGRRPIAPVCAGYQPGRTRRLLRQADSSGAAARRDRRQPRAVECSATVPAWYRRATASPAGGFADVVRPNGPYRRDVGPQASADAASKG